MEHAMKADDGNADSEISLEQEGRKKGATNNQAAKDLSPGGEDNFPNEIQAADAPQTDEAEQEASNNLSESIDSARSGRIGVRQTPARKKVPGTTGTKKHKASKTESKKQVSKARFFPDIKSSTSLSDQRDSVRSIARQIGAMTNARAKELAQIQTTLGNFQDPKIRRAENVLFEAIEKRATRIDKLCSKMEEMQEVFNRPRSKGKTVDLDLLHYEESLIINQIKDISKELTGILPLASALAEMNKQISDGTAREFNPDLKKTLIQGLKRYKLNSVLSVLQSVIDFFQLRDADYDFQSRIISGPRNTQGKKGFQTFRSHHTPEVMMISSNPDSNAHLGDWSSSPIAFNSQDETDHTSFVKQNLARERSKKQKTDREEMSARLPNSQYISSSSVPNPPSKSAESTRINAMKVKYACLLQGYARKLIVRLTNARDVVERVNFTRRKVQLTEDQAAAKIQNWLRGILLRTFRIPIVHDKSTLLSLLTNALFDKQRLSTNSDDDEQNAALAKANLAYTISTIEAENERSAEMLQRIETLRETTQGNLAAPATKKQEIATARPKEVEGGTSRELEFWSSHLKPKRIDPELSPDVNTFNDISLQEVNLTRHATRCRQKIDENVKKKYFTYDGAAAKIQSMFRGHIVRKNILPKRRVERERQTQKRETTTAGNDKAKAEVAAKAKPQAEAGKGSAGAAKDITDEEKAAVKIQSRVRGYQTRRQPGQVAKQGAGAGAAAGAGTSQKVVGGAEKAKPQAEAGKGSAGAAKDITDEEKAAVKIQSRVRGYQTRRQPGQVAKQGAGAGAAAGAGTSQKVVGGAEKAKPQAEAGKGAAGAAKDITDEEKAAVKIQSRVRGYQTRRQPGQVAKQGAGAGAAAGAGTSQKVVGGAEKAKPQAEAGKDKAKAEAAAKAKPQAEAGKGAAGAAKDITDEEKAAVKIQSRVRGYQTRQKDVNVRMLDKSESVDVNSSVEERKEIETSKPPSRRSDRLATPMDDWNFKFSLQLMKEFVFLVERVREYQVESICELFGGRSDSTPSELVSCLLAEKSTEEKGSSSRVNSTPPSSSSQRHQNVADTDTWSKVIEMLKAINSRISSAIEKFLGTAEEDGGRSKRLLDEVRESLKALDSCKPVEISLLLHLLRKVDERQPTEVEESTVKSVGQSSSRRGKVVDDDTIDDTIAKITQLLENSMNQVMEAKEKAVMDAVRINEELKQKLEEIDQDRSLRDQEEKATILATEDIVQSGKNMASIMRTEASQMFQKAKLDLERNRAFWENEIAKATKQCTEEKERIDKEMKESIRLARKNEQDAEAKMKHAKRKLAIARDEHEKLMEAESAQLQNLLAEADQLGSVETPDSQEKAEKLRLRATTMQLDLKKKAMQFNHENEASRQQPGEIEISMSLAKLASEAREEIDKIKKQAEAKIAVEEQKLKIKRHEKKMHRTRANEKIIMKALEIEQQVMQEAKSAKQQAELSREIQEETDSRAREALVAEARQKLNELSVAERKVQEEYINLKTVLKHCQECKAWRKISSKDGRIYWWNKRTNETTWKIPKSVRVFVKAQEFLEDPQQAIKLD
ncbi:hypothetical protein GUITHDRAFT_115881 [Guillardia theta CCMP2712]|uniref:WW domain-containing protein n=1 Tax=Guillardia theta (strain CCMP2712) TaxID=905079 RepID=L1IPB8_GUITC|nr:hypothetical protein GUITHDRAFT_115881 [Guillardia theta CCMP2712]EKX37907.1 hypothetical protein GUITHDRAFT_115881 [Guillardia theta CCMP2712]|eukprot:XP_005824887.1 hypothetical protein GUITHDRAFT_115881 [Guillardia theta CCMP2712]